jgi:hypothetical protein
MENLSAFLELSNIPKLTTERYVQLVEWHHINDRKTRRGEGDRQRV